MEKSWNFVGQPQWEPCGGCVFGVSVECEWLGAGGEA